MHYSRKILVLPAALLCSFWLGGCYTQLASFQNDTMPTGSAASGRCEDCGDEVAASNRREVCVWERDIFGFPEMRCYTTNYASSWMYFHNTPWWYRNSYGWYDNRGCPAYYYYDRPSGVCRYYGGTYRPPSGGGTGSGSGGGMTPGTAPRRSAGTPEIPVSSEPSSAYAEPYSGGTMFTGSTKQLSPAGAPVPQPSSSENLSKPQESTTANQGQSQQAPAAEPQKQKDEPQRPQQPRRSAGVPAKR